MRKYEFVFEAEEIERRRRLEDPDVVGYEEKGKTKKATASGIIDQVIVTLKGKRSEYFTKLANRYDKAKKLKEQLAKDEANLKADTRRAVDELFDASDEVYKRIVETASLVFAVARAEERTTKKMDEAGFIAELEQLTGLAVEELEKIRKKYTTTVTTKVEPKVLAPKPLKGKNESIQVNEGVLDTIESVAAHVKKLVMSFLSKWDVRFASLKEQIEAELNFGL